MQLIEEVHQRKHIIRENEEQDNKDAWKVIANRMSSAPLGSEQKERNIANSGLKLPLNTYCFITSLQNISQRVCVSLRL